MRVILGFMLSLALVAAASVGPAQGQRAVSSGDPVRARVPTQGDVARMLLSDDVAERAKASSMARMVRPEHVSSGLRLALALALNRETAAYEADIRSTAATAGSSTLSGTPREWRLHAELLQTVVALDDPRTTPFLARNLGTNLLAVRALANFGQTAASSVLAVTNSDNSSDVKVGGGLIALRMMIENASATPLSTETRARVRQAAVQFLGGERSQHLILWRAIDLAIALGDTDLRAKVRAIAGNPDEVRARGIQDPTLVAQTQQRARDRLAGVPAQPRR